MSKINKIAVFSGKRGGFGALMNIMKLINDDKNLELQLIVTDMHLSRFFGYTANEVSKFFRISKKISLSQIDDSGISKAVALGFCLSKTSKALQELKPDILIILGDRGEVLSAAIAAMELNIPIFHILGGDLAGNRDGNRIHAITKIAHIHFPSSKDSYNRIISLGEEKWRVKNYGATYVDNIIQKNFTKKNELQKKFKIKPNEKFFICIQHPTTLNEKNSFKETENLLAVLKKYKVKVIIVYPCSDQGYKGVIDSLNKNKKYEYFKIYKNIEAKDFWGLMSISSLFIGNSSSGLIETPYFNLPTVNLGNRQNGRIRDVNVINSDYKLNNIKTSIDFALSDKFKNKIKNNYIFGYGDASKKIFKYIKNFNISQKILEKKMTY